MFKWFYRKLYGFLLYLGVAMYRTDIDILKSNSLNVNEKDKKIQRKRHRSQLLEKFYIGETDQKYVKDYYELLKKADHYILNATSRKMDLTADKWGMSYGRKDPITGKKHEHLGYFDPSNKNYGKTLGEVIKNEIVERKSNDDDYDVKYMIDNRPITTGLVESIGFVNEDEKTFNPKYRKPVMVNRENNEIINKIEELADYIHVKVIGFEHRYFEFFIHNKFGLNKHEENSDVFKDIININNFWWRDKYGKLYGFNIDKYIKKFPYNEYYEIIKFQGTEIEEANIV